MDKFENSMIEKYVDEINKLSKSETYRRGKKIDLFLKNIRHFKFIKAMKNLLSSFKTEKNKTKTNKISINFNHIDRKIVVYTCVTGKYDNLKDPLYYDNNIDYIVFSDTEIKSSIWKWYPIPEKLIGYSNNNINRYIKMHPHEFFSDKYDYALYIDGNVLVLAPVYDLFLSINTKVGFSMHKHVIRNCVYDEIDACIKFKKGNKANLKKYKAYLKSINYPKNNGLLEATVIAYNLISLNFVKIMDEWWNKFIDFDTNRDQIVLPLVLHDCKISLDDVSQLGENVYSNLHFIIESH